jgi:hypothetical protein
MEKANIPIDPDLHAELRAYCDRCGIRFIDFVEDALEQAIRFEEILDKSEKADQVLNQATKNMQRSFRHGFHVGLVAGVFMAQGRLGSSKDSTPSELSYRNEPNKVVTGSQLSLFESLTYCNIYKYNFLKLVHC